MKHKEIKSDLDPFMRVNLKEINSAGNVDTRTLIKSNECEKKIGNSGKREVFWISSGFECKKFKQILLHKIGLDLNVLTS